MKLVDLTDENVRYLFTKLSSIYTIDPKLIYKYQAEFTIERTREHIIISGKTEYGYSSIALIKQSDEIVLIWFDTIEQGESEKLYINISEIDEYFGINR